MKALARLVLLAALTLSLGLLPALADPVDPISEGDYIRFIDRPGSPGGEFGVALASDPTNELFRTFCLERTESLNFSSTFYVDDISLRAYAGSVGPAGDPISDQTAWLYWAFRTGALAALGYDGSATAANALQAAIWAYEGEGSVPTSGLALTFYEAAQTAVTGGWRNGVDGNVAVMNIRYGGPTGALAQSQLILVPEPAALILLGVGLLGVAVSRRHRS